jgi:hypothetical protein
MANLFRYYQTDEKGKWKVTNEKDGGDKTLTSMGAKRASILLVSAVIDEETDPEKLSYKGPMYVDIDSKDLQKSIDSAKAFVQKLSDLGVPQSAYEVHASGSKGFHIYIHPSAFGQHRAVRRLPYIYAEIAVDLYVPGLDFQVYCGGRGNLFRLPNVKRDDGKYKSPIFVHELQRMTPESYAVLTSEPRAMVGYGMQEQKHPVSALVQLFEAAKVREARHAKERQKTPVPDGDLGPFAEDPPQCMQDLQKYHVRTGVNFNQVVYQMAIFLARAGTSKTKVDSVADLTAKHGTSTSYRSERDRADHIKGLTNYMRNKPHKQFSCAAMRSVWAKPDCESCPLYNKTQHLEEQYDVVERPNGYYAMSAKGAERRLTNFILVPRRIIVSWKNNGQKHREYTRVTIERDHERLDEINLPDDCWNSKSRFLQVFTGVADNIMATVGDNDVQILKHFILRDIDKVEEQEEVQSVGIHRQVVGKKPKYTYVEPGMSINRFVIPNTHRFTSKVSTEDAALPNLLPVERVWQGDDRHAKAIRNLLSVNELEVTSALFGWFMAAHLKAHIFGLRSEFPLIGVWGGRGSGKTQTSSLFGTLHGCDFFHHPPPTLTAITPFAFLSHAEVSNTVPRIFDEFNKGGMGQSRYAHFSEYLKNIFNNSSSAKGAVRRTQLTVDYHKPTSPVVILSEHQFEVPALRDRLYPVMVREPSLRPRTVFFEEAKTDAPLLFQIAKESVMAALDTREEWVSTTLKGWIDKMPAKFSDRQRFCRAAILTGIDFAERVLVETLKLDLSAELVDARQAFVDHVNNEKLSTTGVGTTEVDALLARLGEMVILSRTDQLQHKIHHSNFQLTEDGNFALIDPASVFPILKLYISQTRDRIPLNNAGEMDALLRAEPYFVGEELQPEMIQSRPVMRLDLAKMEDKGINVSAFRL